MWFLSLAIKFMHPINYILEANIRCVHPFQHPPTSTSTHCTRWTTTQLIHPTNQCMTANTRPYNTIPYRQDWGHCNYHSFHTPIMYIASRYKCNLRFLDCLNKLCCITQTMQTFQLKIWNTHITLCYTKCLFIRATKGTHDKQTHKQILSQLLYTLHAQALKLKSE